VPPVQETNGNFRLDQAGPFSDCQRCGACCHAREGTLLVTEADVARWRELGRADLATQITPGHFGQCAFAMGPDGACAHLGLPGAPNDCSIHSVRADVCRDFRPGDWQCLEARRHGRLG
jgi:Fe-S-cluster containining protein